MKIITESLLYSGFLLAGILTLCSSPNAWSEGGETVAPRPVFRQGSDSRKDEMKERQEKARRDMQKALTKSIKDAEERRVKREKEDRKKKNKDKNKKGTREMIVVPGKGASIGRIEFDPKKKRSQSREPFVIMKGDPNSGPSIIKLEGPDSARMKAYKNGTFQLLRPDGSGMKLLKSGEMTLLTPPEKRRSFWDKMFGKKKHLDPQGRPAIDIVSENSRKRKLPEGAGSKVGAPVPEGQKDSIIRRLAAELAARRLEQVGDQKIKDADPKELPKAAVVNPERISKSSKPLEDASSNKRIAAMARRSMPKSGIERAKQIQQDAEKLFLMGLQTRDLMLRGAAYRYAAQYHRREAIPFLLKDLNDQKFLPTLAAACLGAMGPSTKEMERVLLKSLQSQDGAMRQNCTESLGRLRIQKAAPLLTKLLPTELNYRVRSSICEALGRIGERKAIKALKNRLAKQDEIPLVKAQAALALARMGDRSGRKYLLDLLSKDHPALQTMGLAGLVRLKDFGTTQYLATALASRFDEVWVAAIQHFPSVGPARAMPVLRNRLRSNFSTLRRRAALAMGALGSDEGTVYIAQALKVGNPEERKLASALLGALGRSDYIPLLIQALKDPQSTVRINSALSLARLNAKNALPQLMEAARGAKAPQDLPPSMRSVIPDVMEMANLLAAIRILQGAEKDLVLRTMPSKTSTRWVEFEKALFPQQLKLITSYKVVDVLGDSKAGTEGVLAVLKDASDQEHMLRIGEPVAAGFRIRTMSPAVTSKGKQRSPAFVSLFNGKTRVLLIQGREPEITDTSKKNK